ncbi:MAG TPA: RNA methyltransferase [Bacteroidales bacterium]|nr:RNA methyltransferase [Bacteroidales bacterium]
MRKLRIEEMLRLDTESYKAQAKRPLAVVLDNIRSHHNTGAVFRTADAFRLEKLYLCGITGTPPHRDIHKTALGATESVEWEYAENTIEIIEHLKRNNYCILALEQAEGSVMLGDFTPLPNQKYALVIGHEVRGVQQQVLDLCDICLEIPQYGTKHSLNVSVSAGIAMYYLSNLMPLA